MPYFIDVHSEYQRGLDFKRVKALGYTAAIIKASQGTGYVPSGTKAFVAAAERAGLTIGLYAFLDNSNGDRQALHFTETVQTLGGPRNRLLVVDFEQHPNPSQTATNRTLHDFVAGVKKRTNDHAVICYSGYGFWSSGDASGSAKDYGIDATWDARYPDVSPHNYPRAYYHRVKDWYWQQPKWGGMRPIAWQFTSAGRVAGQYIDVDRLFIPKADLLKYTTRGAVVPHPDPLPDYVKKPIEYLEKCVGGKYVVWTSGHFRDGPPAWCENSPPPSAATIRERGGFCASALNLACRVNGLRIFKDTAVSWAGGVKWWGERVAAQGIRRAYQPEKTYPPGTMFLRRYTGPQLVNQGHVAVQGRHGRLLQSDAFDGVLRPGFNESRTHRQTHELLKKFDGGGWEYVVPPELWLRG